MALPSAPGVRKRPFTDREKDVLLSLLQKYADIIEIKRTDSVTSLKKKRTWVRLTEEYNASPYVTQQSTVKQLEKAWKNMKAKDRAMRKTEYGLASPENSVLKNGDSSGSRYSYNVPSSYSITASDAFNLWGFDKNDLKNQNDNDEFDTQSDVDCVYETSKGYSNQPKPEEQHHLQGSQFYGQLSQETSTRIGDIEITAMQPLTISHANTQPEICDTFDGDSSRDSSQSFTKQMSQSNDEVKLQSRCSEELYDLRVQLTAAQLAKVRTETVLLKQLLNEQLRKAKAEADLAELLLERNRTAFST